MSSLVSNTEAGAVPLDGGGAGPVDVVHRGVVRVARKGSAVRRGSGKPVERLVEVRPDSVVVYKKKEGRAPVQDKKVSLAGAFLTRPSGDSGGLMIVGGEGKRVTLVPQSGNETEDWNRALSKVLPVVKKDKKGRQSVGVILDDIDDMIAHLRSKGNTQAYRSADEVLVSLFGVPPLEHALQVWPCGYKRGVVASGWLFLSENFLCFFSDVFTNTIVLVLPLIEMKVVKKAHDTAHKGLIVCDRDGQQFFFTSFRSRTHAHRTITANWTSLRKSGLPDTERAARTASSLGIVPGTSGVVIARKTSNADTAEEEAIVDNVDFDKAVDLVQPPKAGGLWRMMACGCAELSAYSVKHNLTKKDIADQKKALRRMSVAPPEMRLASLAANRSLTDIPDEAMMPRRVAITEELFPVCVADFYSLILSSQSTFWSVFNDSFGCFDIEASERTASPLPGGGEVVMYTYKQKSPVKLPMVPKIIITEETIRLRHDTRRDAVVTDGAVRIVNLLGGDKFLVHQRWVVTSMPGGGGCRLSISQDYEFLKPMPLKSIVVNNGESDYRKKVSAMITAIHAVINESPLAPPTGPGAAPGVQTLMQRRRSIAVAYQNAEAKQRKVA